MGAVIISTTFYCSEHFHHSYLSILIHHFILRAVLVPFFQGLRRKCFGFKLKVAFHGILLILLTCYYDTVKLCTLCLLYCCEK